MRFIQSKNNGRRKTKQFIHIEVENYGLWWSVDLELWATEAFFDRRNEKRQSWFPCKSLRAFRRHLRNHPELHNHNVILKSRSYYTDTNTTYNIIAKG